MGTDDRDLRRCGLCGRGVCLSRTHVPPKCAGNGNALVNYRVRRDGESGVQPGRRRRGGMVFRGLCATCNNYAGRFDQSYGQLVDLLPRPDEVDRRLVLPNWQPSVREGVFFPGGVARSMLVSAFALNPKLRTLLPGLADLALAGEQVDLAQFERRLVVANATGEFCRAAGSLTFVKLLGGPRPNGKPLSCYADASVHLRPLAWILADLDYGMTDHQQWVDVSHWLRLDPGDERNAAQELALLPAVEAPGPHTDWAILLSDENCIWVEAVASYRGSQQPTLGGVPIAL